MAAHPLAGGSGVRTPQTGGAEQGNLPSGHQRGGDRSRSDARRRGAQQRTPGFLGQGFLGPLPHSKTSLPPECHTPRATKSQHARWRAMMCPWPWEPLARNTSSAQLPGAACPPQHKPRRSS